MTTDRMLFRWFSFTFGLPALALMLALGSPAFGQSNPTADRIRQIDRMIDAMASRNKAPKMVDASSFDTDFYNAAPLVSRDYDWSEQDRVRQAVLAVRNDKSDEMWWRLRTHIGDKRYALTVVFDDIIDAVNVDVGEFCFRITHAKLNAAYVGHLPKFSGRMPSTFDPGGVVDKNEKKWAGRPLYELQIEVCEEAIRQMASLKATESTLSNDYRVYDTPHTFTAEEKTEFAKAVGRQIEELQRTKKAVTADRVSLRGIDFHDGPWEPLRAKSADEVRKAYKREKGGQPKIAVDGKRLIDALENHNRPPAILREPHFLGPCFDKDYKWSEQARVLKAIQRVVDHAEEIWPEIVQHLNDNRYCLTCDPFENPHNFSIGDACTYTISTFLSEAYFQKVPDASEQAFNCLNFPDVARQGATKLKAWCEKHKDQKLYELQIEMCEWAIPVVGKLSEVSEKQRLESMAELRQQIESLRKSKAAVKPRHFGRWPDGLGLKWPVGWLPSEIEETRESSQKDSAQGMGGGMF